MHGWQKTLRPWAEEYADLTERIAAHCLSLTDAQLQAFDDAAKRPSQTNCWWAMYQVAPLIRNAVAVEQLRRRAAQSPNRKDA